MTSTLKGVTTSEARRQFATVIELLTGKNALPVDLGQVGDLAALQGVRQFPARVKCATLSWHALEAALKGNGKTSTE